MDDRHDAWGARQEPRRYVRKLKSGGWGVYSTVVNLHGFYETEEEARRAAKEGRPGRRIVDKHGRLAMDEDDLRESLDPVAHCDKEWPNDAPHRWED